MIKMNSIACLGIPVAVMTLTVCLLGTGRPAFGHITAQPNEAIAGEYFQTSFVVPHGCNGTPTIALRVKIPEGVISVKPQMKAGWEVTLTNRKLEKPINAGHGQMITETIDEVSWRGGTLPDNLFDTFGMVMKLPDASSQTLYFPVVQECKDGVHRWITVPSSGQSWGDVREPAPFVRLKPKTP